MHVVLGWRVWNRRQGRWIQPPHAHAMRVLPQLSATQHTHNACHHVISIVSISMRYAHSTFKSYSATFQWAVGPGARGWCRHPVHLSRRSSALSESGGTSVKLHILCFMLCNVYCKCNTTAAAPFIPLCRCHLFFWGWRASQANGRHLVRTFKIYIKI